MDQLAESEAPQEKELAVSSDEDKERVQSLEAKVKLLEKDLFYYKKTSRELRKRLQGGRDDGGRETKARTTGIRGGEITTLYMPPYKHPLRSTKYTCVRLVLHMHSALKQLYKSIVDDL